MFVVIWEEREIILKIRKINILMKCNIKLLYLMQGFEE